RRLDRRSLPGILADAAVLPSGKQALASQVVPFGEDVSSVNIRDRGFWLAGILALACVVFLIDLFTPITAVVRVLDLALVVAAVWLVGERVALRKEIAERKSSEETVRQSEERLRLALDGGRIGLWEWQIGTNQAVWNAWQYKLLGLPAGAGEPGVELFFRHVH